MRRMDATVRERVLRWNDPAAVMSAASKLSGIEYVRAMQRGDLPPPPMAHVVNLAFLEVAEGRVVCSAQAGEEHYNPVGTVHGGFAMTVLDSAVGMALLSTLPPGKLFTTLSLTTNFVRAMSARSGPVRCEGVVLHRGGRVATAEGYLYDESQRLCAHAVTSCMILDRTDS